MSYVYRSGPRYKKDESKEIYVDCFEVGYYNPKGQFIIESIFERHDHAQNHVSYLNGGSHPSELYF